MKKYLIKVTGIAALAVLLTGPVFSQDEKGKTEWKEKKSPNEEVVIIARTNKDTKVVVEVKDGEVLVNGKPADQFKDGDITVRRNRYRTYNGGARVLAPTSPFRGGQAWTIDSDRAYLGVSTEKSDKGAKIVEVSGSSAAEKAGLKEGDIITKVDDTRVEDHDDLTTAIRKHKPEDKVTVTYIRDGKENKATAVLGKNAGAHTFVTPDLDFDLDFDFQRPMELEGLNGLNRIYSYGRPRLGIRAQDTEEGKGVKVLDVAEGSAADKAGIKEGDIIMEFDGKNVNTADELADAAKASKDKTSMTVKFQRNGKSQTAEVKIPKKLKTTNL